MSCDGGMRPSTQFRPLSSSVFGSHTAAIHAQLSVWSSKEEAKMALDMLGFAHVTTGKVEGVAQVPWLHLFKRMR